jgi:hypothetical protein
MILLKHVGSGYISTPKTQKWGYEYAPAIDG